MFGQSNHALVDQAVAQASQADCQPAAVAHAKQGAEVQADGASGVVQHRQPDQHAADWQQDCGAGRPPHGGLQLRRLAAAQDVGCLAGQPSCLAVQAHVAVLVVREDVYRQLAARQVVAGRAARAAVLKQTKWSTQTGRT